MVHAQGTHFVFRRNGRVHLNRPGASVQSTTGSRVVRISGSNAGYTMFRGSVKGTGYPLHSPVHLNRPVGITTADAAQLCCQQSTELTPTGRLKWTRPFRAKDEISLLRVCHLISNAVYISTRTFRSPVSSVG